MVGQPDAVGGLVEGVAGRVGWGPVRVLVTEPQLRLDSEPTMRDVSEALVAVYGSDYGIHSPTWLSRFTDMTRVVLQKIF